MKAKAEFEAARNALTGYCEKATDYVCEVKEGTYPLKVVFTPNDKQEAMFPLDKNYGVLEITVGLDTKVRSTLEFQMDSDLLKKLIKNAEKIAFLYYPLSGSSLAISPRPRFRSCQERQSKRKVMLDVQVCIKVCRLPVLSQA